ncbi:MAG TPA: hypothetical protein VL443_08320 [Cyclobacteriaceae bacterium]|jgi:hypothetical protein|nr:hypothetical protein [Cyclobacteriaceae bacterium]
MNKTVYTFFESGCIPGIPGQFHAGQRVIVDQDRSKIIKTSLLDDSIVQPELNSQEVKVLLVPKKEK